MQQALFVKCPEDYTVHYQMVIAEKRNILPVRLSLTDKATHETILPGAVASGTFCHCASTSHHQVSADDPDPVKRCSLLHRQLPLGQQRVVYRSLLELLTHAARKLQPRPKTISLIDGDKRQRETRYAQKARDDVESPSTSASNLITVPVTLSIHLNRRMRLEPSSLSGKNTCATASRRKDKCHVKKKRSRVTIYRWVS